MKQGTAKTGLRFILGTITLTVCLSINSSSGLQAQVCLPIPLQGLSDSLDAGERVLISAQLTTGCNLAIVDDATLVCRFADGREIRRDILLHPRESEGYTQAEAQIEMPTVSGGVSGECFIEFTQCNDAARTCAVDILVNGVRRPDGRVSPTPIPRPRPVPTPKQPGSSSPKPNVGSTNRGGGAGSFFRGMGWLGVAVGLAAYADAGSKEEEGRTAEADESEELGNQILVASSALLLVGYSMDGSGFVSDGDPPPLRRFRPMLAVDPVHRAVYMQVSFTFD